jgi:hypothetical protein
MVGLSAAEVHDRQSRGLANVATDDSRRGAAVP